MKTSKNRLKFILLWIVFFLCTPGFVQAQEVGDRTSNISMPISQNQNVELKELSGKYVLLHFWASWCPTSNIQIPNLSIIRSKYFESSFKNGDGNRFDVFSISMDKNEEAWKAGMIDSGLDWDYSSCDFSSYESPVAIAYGIDQTPMNFLLDPSGLIIGKNLTIPELDAQLEKLLILSSRTEQTENEKNEEYVAILNSNEQNTLIDEKEQLNKTNSIPVKDENKVSFNHFIKINVGTFPSLSESIVEQLSVLGEIEIQWINNDSAVVYISEFQNEQTANYILQEVKRMGYREGKLEHFSSLTKSESNR